jgi:predicted PurR-regulated permease PerM
MQPIPRFRIVLLACGVHSLEPLLSHYPQEDFVALRPVSQIRRPGSSGQSEGGPAEGSETPAPPDDSWTTAAQVSVIGVFALLFLAFLDIARPILVPLVSAVVIGAMLGPVASFARSYRVPSWLTALLLTALFVALVNGVIVMTAAPLIDWIQRAPEIGATLREKLHVFDPALASWRGLRDALLPIAGDSGLKVDTGGPNLIGPAVAFLTPAIGQMLLFIGTLFFFLLSRDELRRYLVTFFEGREERLRTLRILNNVERSLTHYLSIVAVIYFGMGCITTAICLVVGIPNAFAFGIIAFVLNFIPYIGPSLMAVILLGAGLVTSPGLVAALIAPGAYLVAATLEGHFVTPSILGRTLTLSPFMVFLALAFWTWLWGPVGAFLAVPLLIGTLTALHHIRPQNEVNLPG